MSSQNITPIIILGMHRSGTSCLAGALQQAGLYLGNVSEHNPYNKKGNREHNEIMQLNDSILSHNNSSWDSPPNKPLKWTEEHIKTAQNLIHSFENNTTTGYWGFKDPRTLLTLPFWKSVLINPIFIGTFRNPLQVAQSLCHRKNSTFDIPQALSLWEVYNHMLTSAMAQHPIRIISFDQNPTSYQKKLIEISTLLKLPTSEKIDFFDGKLITNNQSNKNETEQYLTKQQLGLYDHMEKKQF